MAAPPARGRWQPDCAPVMAAPASGEGGVAMVAPGPPEGGGGLVVAELPPLRRADPDEHVRSNSGRVGIVGWLAWSAAASTEHHHQRRARSLPVGTGVTLIDGFEEHRHLELHLCVPSS